MEVVDLVPNWCQLNPATKSWKGREDSLILSVDIFILITSATPYGLPTLVPL